ncbi:hypothetical protein AAE02nite_10570 [Adhaeribacter aerolatus]|uniref:DUF1573 domain-containing protein n=1 Tax=Adhaeribacter aerolatus TaxID=670289 RepID=A0A512AUP1_9BACT|nr:DUF1573 domain-containing protein [Adhaeribacter aerolatus]GEO03393.1 hypothetical protein AAE02nite_10570 [Adhaeribacter aerolatus]
MKKNIIIAAAAALFFATSCDQKASTDAGTEQTASANATSEVAHNTVHNPNTANPQEITANADAPVMTFKETEYDFGSIKDGEVVRHTFVFTNTGKSPLVIESATSTCGCTVPEVPKEPVAPGAEGKLEVEFNSAGKGGQQVLKVISVKANTQPEINQVNIKVNVKPSPGANGPFRS